MLKVKYILCKMKIFLILFIYKNYTGWKGIRLSGYEASSIYKYKSPEKGTHGLVKQLAKPLLHLNRCGNRGNKKSLRKKLLSLGMCRICVLTCIYK